jgi:hypothetical protein
MLIYFHIFNYFFRAFINFLLLFKVSAFLFVCEKTKTPLGPPVGATQWVRSDRPARSGSTSPTPLSSPHARSNPNPNLLWRPASPPPSPLDSGEVRRTWPPPWCAINAPHDGGHSYPRRSDADDLLLSVSSPSGARVTGSARSRRSWRSWCLDSALASPPWCWRCRGVAMARLGLAPPLSGVCRHGRHGRAYLLDQGRCFAAPFHLCLSSSSSSIPGQGFPPCGGAGLLMLVLCCA